MNNQNICGKYIYKKKGEFMKKAEIMKKGVQIFCLISFIVFLSGCTVFNKRLDSTAKPSNETTTQKTTSETAVSPAQLKVEDYFPSRQNIHYIYEGYGNEYASYDIYIDYAAEGKIQQRINNGGTELARVIEVREGKAAVLFSREETYFRENFLNKTKANPEILLMEPLVKGTTWTLSDGRVRTITRTEAGVSTPSGTYKAIEVTTAGNESKTADYYAKDIGLVKSVFDPGGNEITSSLAKAEENVPLVQRIRFYYPDINDEKQYYKERDISFNTNDITRKALESAYKQPSGSAAGAVLTPNTKINFLYLNEDGKVYVDLSSDFIKEMNAGSGYEGMMLQSIANTFGNYYNASKVVLTIDNKLYESGHFAFKKGEYLNVKLENSVEIK